MRLMSKEVWIKAVFFTYFCFLFLAGVFALHVVTNTVNGGTNFSTVNEDFSTLYNLTLNNTDASAGANITQINITLPSNFTFIVGTANASAPFYNFSNSSSILSFTNITGLVGNGTWRFFWFNASAAVPGVYNFSIVTSNLTTIVYHNLSVVINDTTVPQPISYAAPGYTAYTNQTSSSIPINTSVYDEGTVGIINITLYSSGYSSVLNSSNSTWGARSHYHNFTNLSDGIYFVNVTANDSNGNINLTVPSLRIAVDRGAPSVSLTEESSNRTFLNITIAVSDAVTGANGSCTSMSGGGTIIGSGATQYLSRNNLECGEEYTFNVSCMDYLGNVGYGSDTFTTDSCASSGGSSGGGGGGGGSTGGSGSTYWQNTISVSSNQFTEGYSAFLKTRERFRVSVGGSDHHVGVIDIDSTTVTVNVSSTPQQAVLRINATKLFEVTDDSYYDISLTLTEINSSRTGANITILSVHELTPAGAAALGINSTLNQSNNQTSSGSLGTLFSESSWWLWVVLALALVAVVLVLWRLYDRHQRLKGLKVNESS